MKTVIIKREGCPGGCKINESDFIEGEMELFSASRKDPSPVNYKKKTMEQLADILNERDIEFDLSMKKPELVALLVEADKEN
jgi:hypothetical protein